jgi:hypothetical protein
MSESYGLPALRRYRICCQASGRKRQVRRGGVYPSQMSSMRRHREKLTSTFYRGLTARPVVLAKTYVPGAVCFPALNRCVGPYVNECPVFPFPNKPAVEDGKCSPVYLCAPCVKGFALFA